MPSDINTKISIIIPIFNEEENIQSLHDALSSALAEIPESSEIIFINDGSQDNSAELLDQLALQNKHVKVLHFRRNFGQTAAMAAGFDHALGEIIIPMDGDLQNDPRDIKLLLAKIEEGYDVVSGWRKDRKDPWLRKFLSRVANRIISKLIGVYLHDYGCSLKAYRREVIEPIRLYGEMHRFIPVYASWNGAKITEIPVNHNERKKGVSKYGIDRTIKVILDMVTVFFYSKYSQKPIYVFGGFGLIAFLGAFGAGCFAIYLKLFEGKPFVETPMPLLTVLLIMLGCMSILLGLLAEMIMRTYHESQQKNTYIIKKISHLSNDEEQ